MLTPCAGATHLLFPEPETESGTPADLEGEPPPFCLTCPSAIALDCLTRGWYEEFGIWGSFYVLDRHVARTAGLTPLDLHRTRFPEQTDNDGGTPAHHQENHR